MTGLDRNVKLLSPIQSREDDGLGEVFSRLCCPLRRFAVVVGPVEVDPDDLLQDASPDTETAAAAGR